MITLFYGGGCYVIGKLCMATINQLVSEFAHSLGQPNNHSLRENLKLLIIHTRNEIIRRSYENHSYVDKGLTQRFKVKLITANDGEINLPDGVNRKDVARIKRTENKVPRPIRLINNLPFDRVSSVGFRTNREIPFIKETTAQFRSAVPGLDGLACYDYINEYIYIFPSDNRFFDLNTICIEGAFEHPNEIAIKNNDVDSLDIALGDNEWLLSEDMIGQLKEIIYKRDLLSQYRQTNEIQEITK